MQQLPDVAGQAGFLTLHGCVAQPQQAAHHDGQQRSAAVFGGQRGVNLTRRVQPPQQAKHRAAQLLYAVGHAPALQRAIRRAAQRLADEGLELCLEPINQFSMPEYFLRTQEQAAAYIERLGLPNLRLQFDFFHCQMEQGNVSGRLRRFFPLIGHCQLAGAPDRHEPDQGELNYPYLLALLDELGYQGVVGCEYNPAGKTVDGLGWLRAWGVVPGCC